MVQDQAGDPRAAPRCSPRSALPRGTSDVQGLSAANMYEMNEPASSSRSTTGKIPNAGNLLPAMKYPYGVGHIYSGKVGRLQSEADHDAARRASRTCSIPSTATSSASSTSSTSTRWSAPRWPPAARPSNIEPGKKLLLECKKAGARIYPTNEAFAQALKTEEIGIGVMWKARVGAVAERRHPVETRRRRAKACSLYISGFVIPKNAPNKDGAYAYLDAMLDKSAQEDFAVDMGYNPTVTNAMVAPDLNKRIGFTPTKSKKRLVDLDYGYIDQERRRVQGVVGQGRSRADAMRRSMNRMADHALTAQLAVGRGGRRRCSRPRRWSGRRRSSWRVGLLVPLAILFRYSLNKFDAAAKIMVEAFTLGELRQVLHRPLLHRRAVDDVARRRDCAPSSASSWAFRSPMCWRAPRRASRIC